MKHEAHSKILKKRTGLDHPLLSFSKPLSTSIGCVVNINCISTSGKTFTTDSYVCPNVIILIIE